MFQTRLALECAIVAEAAWKIEVPALEELRNATAGMREAWLSQDLVRVAERDKHFHETIVKSCGNAMMADIYFSLKDILQETQVHPIPITRMKRAEESIAEHGRIISALHERDRNAAQSAMRDHILKTAAAVGIRLNDTSIEGPLAHGA